jgi:hypothetical protein
MSVEFSKIVFHNNDTFDVDMSIFAPPDQLFASGIEVKAGKSNTLEQIKSDCSGVKFSVTVNDPDHGSTFPATFAVMAPLFLQSIDVAFADGEFQVTVFASTDPPPKAPQLSPKTAY